MRLLDVSLRNIRAKCFRDRFIRRNRAALFFYISVYTLRAQNALLDFYII